MLNHLYIDLPNNPYEWLLFSFFFLNCIIIGYTRPHTNFVIIFFDFSILNPQLIYCYHSVSLYYGTITSVELKNI